MAPPGTSLVASWYVCLVPAAPLIVLRLRSRLTRREQLGIDDFVFIAAIFVVLGFNATMAYMWNQGLADWKAGYRIPEPQFDAMMKMVLPSKLLYISAAWTVKFAVVLSYKVVALPGSRIVTLCYIVMAYLILSWSGVFFYTLFGCLPWDQYWAGGLTYKCPAEFTLISWWLLTCLNISSNVIVVILPIPMVKKLDMRIRDGCAIGFMFVLGSVVIAASSMQSYYNKQNNIMLSATASMVELSAGLIGTSLLALRQTILGKNAFQASLTPRLSLGLSSSHHQAHLNEIKLLESYKNGKYSNSKRSLSISGANSSCVAPSLYSRTRMSTASKDSSVLPGQFHIGFMPEDTREEEEGQDEDGIGRITVCADIDALGQRRGSQVEVQSPGVESWFER